MADSQFFRLGKIKGENSLLGALRHNKRTLPPQANINTAQSRFNYALVGDGTPEEINTYARVQMAKAGVLRLRKDVVIAVEALYSLPINRHHEDTRQFFKDCYDWTKKTFAGELLSFDIHCDEKARHAHALILPLVDGKMRGSAMVGDRANIIRLLDAFHHEVGAKHSLGRGRKRLSAKTKHALEFQVLTKLRSLHDPAMKSVVWSQIRDAIHKDPVSFADCLLPAKTSIEEKHTEASIPIPTIKAGFIDCLLMH